MIGLFEHTDDQSNLSRFNATAVPSVAKKEVKNNQESRSDTDESKKGIGCSLDSDYNERVKE